MKVTCVEVSKAPVEPRIFYVIFDDSKKAEDFVNEVKKDCQFIVLKSYEADEKKFAYPFGRSREIFANITLAEMKKRLYGTGWR